LKGAINIFVDRILEIPSWLINSKDRGGDLQQNKRWLEEHLTARLTVYQTSIIGEHKRIVNFRCPIIKGLFFVFCPYGYSRQRREMLFLITHSTGWAI
jgi:hypothetical protein